MIVVSGSLAYIAQYSYIFGLIFKQHKIPQGCVVINIIKTFNTLGSRI